MLRPGGVLVVDVPQKWHYYTLGKQLLIAAGRWFAGWETQFSPRELERVVARQGLSVERTYGDWMVPGLWYRALRKILLTRLGPAASHVPRSAAASVAFRRRRAPAVAGPPGGSLHDDDHRRRGPSAAGVTSAGGASPEDPGRQLA